MEEFLRELHINAPGKMLDNSLVVDINSYDEFSALYNKLEQSEKLSKDSDESYFNMDNAHVIYLSDNYELILNGDLSNDVYQLSIQELNDEEGE